ncbi:MAG: histidine phosphatase family protein [Hyphomicrobiales bacterium]|nr:histidine phosphatase family protein [Hyphomicrobiales bacterium]
MTMTSSGTSPGIRPAPGQTLYLIRHGETDWNAEGRLQGGRDIPLNDRGRAQAREAGHKLAALVPAAASLDYLCSPMFRARETMELLRETLGLPREVYAMDQRLSESTSGSWEGQTWREVRKLDPARANARERHKWAYVPPGGESYGMLRERILPVFAGLTRDTVVVSHGGVMRAALNGYGFEEPSRAESLDIWQGRIIVLTLEGYRWN